MENTTTHKLTFCISTYNNLEYLKIAIDSVRENSYYKNSPFIIHAENCDDGTDEWLKENSDRYNLTYFIDKTILGGSVKGIGGGMNFCADNVETEYIMFLHSDFYVSKNWDKACLDVFEKYPNKKLWVSSYRVQPNIFKEDSRPGTFMADNDEFGAFHHDFDSEHFENWAEQFTSMNDFEVRKGEGVSGLIRKKDWDEVGGNDPLFSPASWEDMDLFIRMQMEGCDFILSSKSLIYHFGARGSHFPEDDFSKKSDRQVVAESVNARKWYDKWGHPPVFNELRFIKVTDDYIRRYKEIKNENN